MLLLALAIPAWAAPTFESVKFTSSPAHGNTYRCGEEIDVTAEVKTRSNELLAQSPWLRLKVGGTTHTLSTWEAREEKCTYSYSQNPDDPDAEALVASPFGICTIKLFFTHFVESTDTDSDGATVINLESGFHDHGTLTLSPRTGEQDDKAIDGTTGC